jgi:hypothetical protein
VIAVAFFIATAEGKVLSWGHTFDLSKLEKNEAVTLAAPNRDRK